MSTNRVIHNSCRVNASCSVKTCRIERQPILTLMASASRSSSSSTTDASLIPRAVIARLRPKPDGMDGVGIRFLIGEIAEPRWATLDECLYQYAAAELRRIGEALLAAAEALEGGVV